MEDAIREMHGRKIGQRVILVNKAQPKMGSDDPDHGYGGSYPSRGRGSHGGADRSLGQDECFKCGRPGHWARDFPSAGGGRGGNQFSSCSRFGGSGGSDDNIPRSSTFLVLCEFHSPFLFYFNLIFNRAFEFNFFISSFLIYANFFLQAILLKWERMIKKGHRYVKDITYFVLKVNITFCIRFLIQV
ncbi:hypothetical protein L6452_02714 [Arctium lappa]|uniref:Uncharacterized protein n=1 Tax=Arctium lappa TaxID=4217 RepID=A0ACB9FJP1_ARCLA|nr:hypothetical protein L6452_02714 [Arctium lappa]